LRRVLSTACAALWFVALPGAAAVQPAQARTFIDLYNFTGEADGGQPLAGLVRDSAGNLYGTTYSGGASGFGVVFQVTKDGTETVLHSFAGGTDGEYPYSQLVLDSDGNLYGTAAGGGGSGCGGFGCGMVFEVDASGTESVLHSFAGGTTDGCYPHGSLMMDAEGNLYGTTDECGTSDLGTVFTVSSSGAESILHSFAGGSSDGDDPIYAGLVMDSEGNLYGSTLNGGAANDGVVYELDTSGTLTVLHSFSGGAADGCYPYGTPVMDTKSNLYGTAEKCGASGYGVVWKLNRKKDAFSVLHSFTGESSDGGYPVAGVLLGANGKLFGNTVAGGADDFGTVYQLDAKHTFTLLHSFAGPEGEYPSGSLIQDAKGNLYGVAEEGGSGSAGTVWKLTR
jgi:uncharacterized repeat protein (TIGR03803 family)